MTDAQARDELPVPDEEATSSGRGEPPELPSLGVGEWLHKNLFSSKLNAVLTVVSVLIAIGSLRSLLNFIFSEERGWEAVRTNLRLLFTQAYPEDQFVRVWVCVGALVLLAGFSIGMWARWGSLPPRRVISWALATGGLIAVSAVLTQPAALRGAAGEIVTNADRSVVRQSYVSAVGDRIPYLVVAALLLAAGWVAWTVLGDERRRARTVPAVGVAVVGTGLLVLSTWVIRYGHYGFADEVFIAEPGQLVAMSTRVPWTVMWLMFVGSMVLAHYLRSRSGESKALRLAVNLGWLVFPFAAYWVVLRDPAIDYSQFTDLYPLRSSVVLWAVGLAVLGGLLLWWLSNPELPEYGRLVAIATLLLPATAWYLAFANVWSVAQIVRIVLLMLALAALVAPMFAGEPRKRLRLSLTWVALVVAAFYAATVVNSPSTIVTPSGELLGGFMLTVFVAFLTIVFAFPMGVMLALARTSTLPLFRVMATTFIEVVRGVPLITVLLFFDVVFNLFLPVNMEISTVAAAVAGMTLFSAAYLAENVRGGLQSVRRGQFEAADALGLTSTMRTSFIILPQALRVSIPPLVGQVIATFKETSLLAIIGVFDFLRIADKVIPSQTSFLGIKMEGLLFVAAIYWVVSFGMSKYSQRLERRLGVGER